MFKNPEKGVRVNHDSTISISTQIYTLNPSKITFLIISIERRLFIGELCGYGFMGISDSDMSESLFFEFGHRHIGLGLTFVTRVHLNLVKCSFLHFHQF